MSTPAEEVSQPSADDAVALAAAAIAGQEAAPAEGDPAAAEPAVKHFVDDARAAIYAKRSAMVGEPGDESMQAMARASAEALPDDMRVAAPEGEAAAAAAVAASGVPAAVPAVAAEPLAAVTPQIDPAEATRAAIAEAQRQSTLNEAAAKLAEADRILAQARSTAAAPAAEQAEDAGQEALDALMTSDPGKLKSALARLVSEVTPQAAQATATPATIAQPAGPVAPPRSRESVQLANYVFEHEFKDVFASDAAFSAAATAMRERLNDPQYAGVPLDLMARDIGYSMRKQFGAELTPAAQVTSVESQLATREAVKQRLPRSVTAGAAPAVPAVVPQVNEQESRSNYVQQLRARSGSNTAIRSVPASA